MRQRLETRSGDLSGYIIAGVSNRGGGLETVLELNGEHFQIITVVENFGHIKLWHIHTGVRRLVDDELQTNLLKILCSSAILKVVNDGAEHGVRVSDPDQGDVFQVWQVGEVCNIKHWFPTSQGPYVRKDVHKVVHPCVGHLPAVEGHQGELVHLHGADYAEGPQEGVRYRVFSQTGQA